MGNIIFKSTLNWEDLFWFLRDLKFRLIKDKNLEKITKCNENLIKCNRYDIARDTMHATVVSWNGVYLIGFHPNLQKKLRSDMIISQLEYHSFKSQNLLVQYER